MIFSVFANLNNNDTEKIARGYVICFKGKQIAVFILKKNMGISFLGVLPDFSDSSSLMTLCDLAG